MLRPCTAQALAPVCHWPQLASPHRAQIGSRPTHRVQAAPSPQPSQPDPPRKDEATQATTQAPAAAAEEEEYTTVYETVSATEEEEQEVAAPVATHAAAPEAKQQQLQQQAVVAPVAASMPQASPVAPSRVTHTLLASVRPVAPASATAALSPAGAFWQSSVGGWVLAASILLAIRLSRDQADRERMDLSALQLRQQESRVQGKELRERRQAFLEAERVRKEEEAERRMQELRVQAEEAAKQRAAKEAAYRAEMAQETARLKAAQDAARKAFQEQDALMGEELKRRTEVEVRLREEAERKKEQEREKARLEEAERARLAEEARRARAEEEQRQREREAESRARQRQELRRLQTSFTASFAGAVAVQPAPLNTTTSGRVQQLARIQVDVRLEVAELRASRGPGGSAGEEASTSTSASTSNGGGSSGDSSSGGGAFINPMQPQQCLEGYESVEAALLNSDELTGRVVAPVVSEAARLLRDRAAAAEPSPGGQGANGSFALMDVHEVNYWARLCQVQCEGVVRQALEQVVPLAGSSRLEQEVKVECKHSVLPHGHPMRMDSRLGAAAAAVAASRLDEAVALVDQVIEQQEEELGIVSTSGQGARGARRTGDVSELFSVGAATSPRLPPLMVPALVYAQLVDRMAAGPAPPAIAAAPGPVVGEAQSSSSTSPSGDGVTNGSLPGSAEEPSGSGHDRDLGLDFDFDLAADGRSASGSTSSSFPSLPGTGVAALARYQLEQRAKGLPEDALIPTARVMRRCLGGRHPVACVIADLAERTTSAATRRAAEVRRQREEAALAAAELRREQGKELGAAEPSGRSLVPVPERLWATRNVANNLVRFGDARQLGEAVGMLAEADALAAGHYGRTHPARLSTLLDLVDALTGAVMKADGDAPEGASLMSRLLAAAGDVLEIVKAVAERYIAQRDALSVALLYEAVLQDYGELLTQRQDGEVALLRERAEALRETLTPAEMRVVISKRSSGGVLRAAARDFTEELGAYAMSRRSSKLFQWTKDQPLTPIR